MPNDVVKEARELLANAAHGPLTLIRYEHGGGRLYREEPRDLVADFYDAANRELHYRAPELIKTLCNEVECWRRGADALKHLDDAELTAIRGCDKCDLCEDHHA